MTSRRQLIALVVKLVIAAGLSLALFALVLTAVKNPVSGPTRSYSADFTDVSGLRENADVRINGVQVGKVQSIALGRDRGENLAQITFSLQDDKDLTEGTRLAVKYQNLTGVRYVDMVVPDTAGVPVDHISVDMTEPSFDITELFNGLQPVLTDVDPDEMNRFTENALALLQGDGSGLAPMLDSVQKLGRFAQDRQQLISTLVANLSRIADSMGGRSEQVVEFLRYLSVPVDQAMTVLDEFRKTALYGPQFMAPVDRLLIELGLTPDLDVNALLTSAFASVADASEALRLFPAAFDGLQNPQLRTPDPASGTCAHGTARLPETVGILLNGSGVVICNAL